MIQPRWGGEGGLPAHLHHSKAVGWEHWLDESQEAAAARVPCGPSGALGGLQLWVLQALASWENQQVHASGVRPDVALKMKFPSVVQA